VSVVDVAVHAADGHLTLEAKPKACLNAVWSQARKAKANVNVIAK